MFDGRSRDDERERLLSEHEPPRRTSERATWAIGLDLGQASDYTAIAAVERVQTVSATGEADDGIFRVRHLERLPIGMAYPEQVARVAGLVRMPLLAEATLVVDQTGVGRAVFDMFRAAELPVPLVGVSIHGGDTVTNGEGAGVSYRVPKRDLVAVVAVLLATRRLAIAKALPEAKTLTAELLNFRVKIDPTTAHDSYAAWREGQHDDLVLAVALACWYTQTVGRYAGLMIV
jgi:hypothetical protein